MNMEFTKNRVKDVEFLTSPKLTEVDFIKHFFSTRIGGRSTGVFESMNLGIYTDDDKDNIQYNLDKMFESARMDRDKITYLKQEHSDKFYIVNNNNYNDIRGQCGDALITAERGIAIGVFTADCVPIILVDTCKRIIAVIHAGWKGTEMQIASKVLNYMKANLRTDPMDIAVAIGPSIGSCCFEVGLEVGNKFNFVHESKNKFYVDLWKENIKQLTDCGVLEDRISNSRICTSCNNNIVFSYRKESGNTGRLGTFVEII